jgi:rhamnulose-1-phosphate aldolase
MKIINSNFYREALRFIGYGSRMGWHERNAGNISLRLNREEINSVKADFTYKREWTLLSEPVPSMAGELVFTTVSGSYFIDMEYDSENKFCICEISEDGSAYRIVWGGVKPTSELCGHLMSLGELKLRNGGRAVYHCHPANIVSLSYLLPADDKKVSEAIWESETECAFVLPQGIGVVGFYVPGTLELAKATAEKVKKFDAILWSYHGVFACGDSIASAFGLAHAIEKAAEIKIKVLSTGLPVVGKITREQQELTAHTYGYVLNEFK